MTSRTKFPVAILRRPLLIPGALAFKDETTMFVSSLLILVNDRQSKEQQTITLFHEALHLLIRAAGIEAPHDEEWVEERAKALAAACPDLLEKMGMA